MHGAVAPVFVTLLHLLLGYGWTLDHTSYIFGSKYRAKQERKIGQYNFLLCQAKMSIWLTQE